MHSYELWVMRTTTQKTMSTEGGVGSESRQKVEVG